MQPGFTANVEATEIVKLRPGIRSEIYGACEAELQVTCRRPPCVESNVSEMRLSDVTAVVLTTTLDLPPGIDTNPTTNLPQSAGEADEKH
jgi:hypothetical protein